ncbi:MAG: hypothetical protein IPJ41_13820 [Phycisphaerales bacterium]|nr:hypothetical protein [Phycisphaerales bacterium]
MEGGPRTLIEHAAAMGFRGVALDASTPGLRPRELDRSGRRDLAALLRRLELGLAGLDLWVPSAHFADPSLTDRALAASISAIDLARDLHSLNGEGATVSLTLPDEVPASTLHALESHASDRGVRLADHAWPPRDGADSRILGIGLDPAALLLAGENPAKCAARSGARLACARLSDASEVVRVEPGTGRGRLSDLAYIVALQTAGFGGAVLLDLRGLAEPLAIAPRVLRWWNGG